MGRLGTTLWYTLDTNTDPLKGYADVIENSAVRGFKFLNIGWLCPVMFIISFNTILRSFKTIAMFWFDS